MTKTKISNLESQINNLEKDKMELQKLIRIKDFQLK